MRRERGIFERPKGSNFWWVRWCDQHGRLHREKVGPKGLAKDVYAKRKLQVREGKFFPANIRRKREMLFKDLVDLYLEDHSRINKRSWRDDTYRVKPLLEAFGDKALSEITTQDIDRLKGKLAQRMAPGTVNRYIGLLKSIFNKGVQWGKTKHNPTKGVKLFKENNSSTRFLTYEEEDRLKAVMKPEHWRVVEFAFHTGLRRSEQFKLRWRDIDLKNRVITIPRTKGGEVRYVDINDTVMTTLQNLPSRLKSEWVFPSETGVTPKNGGAFVRRVFNPATRRGGLDSIRWHDLRHTFASRLVMKGNDLVTVKELMGHKDVKHTIRYSHLSPGHRRGAVQSLVREENQIQTDTITDTAPVEA